MKTLLTFLPVLGCGLMMVVCMTVMGCARMIGGRRARSCDTEPAGAEEVAALRAEVARLRAEHGDASDEPTVNAEVRRG